MKKIYLDFAATGPVKKEVLKEMLPYFGADFSAEKEGSRRKRGSYFSNKFGNPSSLHSFGREARAAMDKAREKIALFLNCLPSEIIFTSGGSESDNLIIRGLLNIYQNKEKNPHIIISSIEHHAVLHTCQYLENKSKAKVTYIKVDSKGMVNPENIKKAIKPNTLLVSVMYANNEIGTIEPIREIGKYLEKINKERKNKIFFHTDAVQAIGHLNCDIKYLHVDSLTLSAHKFGGPKGVGVLYVKKGIKLSTQITGGGQEYQKRAGTENVAAIVGMAKAIELLKSKKQESKIKKIVKLRDKLINGVLKTIPDTILTGHPEKRLPNSASFCFEFIEGESILYNLDLEGVAASSGSACTSGSLEPSHVLLACGFDHKTAQGSIRFTLGEETAEEEIDYVLKILPKIIKKLRRISPFGRKNV